MATPILSHKPILIFNLGFLGVKVAHCSKWSNPFQGSKETAGPAAALSQWNLRASQVQSGGSRGSSSQARRSDSYYFHPQSAVLQASVLLRLSLSVCFLSETRFPYVAQAGLMQSSGLGLPSSICYHTQFWIG